MGKIIRLDQHTTNLIAAGEVIERAASVVKELVENSIDATASTIHISLLESGLKEIVVGDNGTGMDASDARLALEPHATSKIAKPNDLFHISTLGFRGEALASVVAVSHFKLKTCTAGAKGLMIVLKGGEIISEAIVAHPHGTEITVRNLFYNTPARLQNLKSEAQELSYIVDYVNKMALANPQLAFKLMNNDKLLIQTYGNNDLLEVIASIYGMEMAKNVVKIERSDGYFHIFGYTSNIVTTRSSRNGITIVVNGRVVRNHNIINAVVEGYHNLLMTGRYPFSVINIEVDTSLVDVNVHPAKLEVRFSNEEGLINLIKEAIKTALVEVDLSVSLDQEKEEPTQHSDIFVREDVKPYTFTNKSPSSDFVEEDSNDDTEKEKTEPFQTAFQQQQYSFTKHDEEPTDSLEPKISRLPKMEYIGQLFGTYLLAQSEDLFYLLDQHAANERINYEKIISHLQNTNGNRYELLIPIKLFFTTNEAILINEKMSEINQLGISLEEFGGGTYLVREIPDWIFRGREKEFVEEIIVNIVSNHKTEKHQFLDALAKSLACKKSIKANEFVNRQEIEYLLKELSDCENPFTCPHGRPVIVKFSRYEIEKWFKRIV
ncbi:MAG: DNA mismatch repair endonuclease MutL [Bacilli bacterium]|jgi:DNA mismatch repair protein MutL|nr:DNA mismatch repair endonuclease MutL [Bacilli bacterium]MDD3348314.1 DNA mismatch repair endonuclease MutL [Bacilli bacterium]MDD4057136.1 DNA mismatch repair endonuclease MutL [Bacilli bacterium]MDY0209145.1 DNA mismatch repair endonuclease MutL [Bacilli bacterium]